MQCWEKGSGHVFLPKAQEMFVGFVGWDPRQQDQPGAPCKIVQVLAIVGWEDDGGEPGTADSGVRGG